jgi:lipid-A-disaccharide synthase
VSNLFTITRKIKQCKEEIDAWKPDAVVLIDYAGFNMRIARYARKRGVRVLWYISPKVWAWNQNRAYKLKAVIDRMFVILPFEKEFFKRFGWEVDYVGNPVLDAVNDHQVDHDFLAKTKVVNAASVVALLPGSRRQELVNVIPAMAEVVKQMPQLTFVVAAVDNLPEQLYEPLKGFTNVRFITGSTYDLLAHARAAVVTSGTATLETALFRVPQVVVYRTSDISYRIAKSLIRVPYISLVNLIAGKAAVRELIQRDMNANKIQDELQQLMAEGSYRQSVLEDYDRIIQLLDTGSASVNTAALILQDSKARALTER